MITKISTKSRQETYTKLFRLLNGVVAPTNRLTDKELEVLGFICANSPTGVQFIGPRLDILVAHFNISKNTAYVHRNKLKKKKWLTAAAYLNPSVTTLIKGVDNLDGNAQLTIQINESLTKTEETHTSKEDITGTKV